MCDILRGRLCVATSPEFKLADILKTVKSHSDTLVSALAPCRCLSKPVLTPLDDYTTDIARRSCREPRL